MSTDNIFAYELMRETNKIRIKNLREDFPTLSDEQIKKERKFLESKMSSLNERIESTNREVNFIIK